MKDKMVGQKHEMGGAKVQKTRSKNSLREEQSQCQSSDEEVP
jgi:hypothetical protein